RLPRLHRAFWAEGVPPAGQPPVCAAFLSVLYISAAGVPASRLPLPARPDHPQAVQKRQPKPARRLFDRQSADGSTKLVDGHAGGFGCTGNLDCSHLHVYCWCCGNGSGLLGLDSQVV
ncbi:hypothetical protein HDU91_000861, partial [Kappamyces sp. JEL0680]